jgi:hypothetical protein
LAALRCVEEASRAALDELRILAKLGARDRAQLAVIAYQSGLVKA